MIRLCRGDCYKRLKELPDKSVDLVIMDPPYLQADNAGSGCFGGAHRDYYRELSTMSQGIQENLLDLLVSKMKRINLYTYCNKKQLLQYLSYFSTIKGVNFDLLCWHKLNPIPATHNIYLRDTEYILFFRQTGVKLYGSYATKKTYFLSGINLQDKKKYEHPTVKPLEQLQTLIINSSKPGDIILDPFMGTGTTGVAAKGLDRDFIGIEIDEKYYSTAKARIQKTARGTFL